MSLKLPTAVNVTRILQLCIGTDPVLQQVDRPLDMRTPPVGTYISWLRGDTGEVKGAILATLPTVAFLGGTMILIPEGGQEDHVMAGAVSEDIVDSMAEINNMLRGLFNKVEENEHVSPEEIELFAPPPEDDDAAWIFSPAERIDMAGSFSYGGGHLTILSRRAD